MPSSPREHCSVALCHTPVIVRIEEHGVATISMQKTNVPINLDHHLLARQRSDVMPTADA
jgi:predicted metal-binding protein